jgi:predicted nuclease with TOPRIM domain
LRELNAKLLAEITELRKENTEIPKLREKFAEVETENARLKQIIKGNARRDTENAELKSRVGELEARLALLEQGSVVNEMALSSGVRHKTVKKQCQL